MTATIDDLRRWIGNVESRSDQITSTPIAALSATLDREERPPIACDPLPPLWHWLYFLPSHRISESGRRSPLSCAVRHPTSAGPWCIYTDYTDLFQPSQIGTELREVIAL